MTCVIPLCVVLLCFSFYHFFAIKNVDSLRVLYQLLQSIEFIFHNLFVTFELAVCIQTLYDVFVFWVLNYKFKDFSHIFSSYLSKCFSEDNQHLESIESLAYMCLIWRDIILAIIFCFRCYTFRWPCVVYNI